MRNAGALISWNILGTVDFVPLKSSDVRRLLVGTKKGFCWGGYFAVKLAGMLSELCDMKTQNVPAWNVHVHLCAMYVASNCPRDEALQSGVCTGFLCTWSLSGMFS